jgi:hypothetical protein
MNIFLFTNLFAVHASERERYKVVSHIEQAAVAVLDKNKEAFFFPSQLLLESQGNPISSVRASCRVHTATK